MRKRILRYEDNTVSCDIIFVLRGSANVAVLGKLAKTYNCLNGGSYALQPKNDYECMLYAMLTNPNCKGYLFLSGNDKLPQMGEVLRNERNRIWYGKRTNTRRFEVSFSNKHLLSSNEIAFCKQGFQELALLNQIGFTNYKKYLNTSWHKPWNVEIALNALLWNGKGKFVCFYEEVKTFYVPVKYRTVFLGVASIFRKVKMPNAIAVPTILKSLDLESTFINIST
jgi:hypothetical protein